MECRIAHMDLVAVIHATQFLVRYVPNKKRSVSFATTSPTSYPQLEAPYIAPTTQSG